MNSVSPSHRQAQNYSSGLLFKQDFSRQDWENRYQEIGRSVTTQQNKFAHDQGLNLAQSQEIIPGADFLIQKDANKHTASNGVAKNHQRINSLLLPSVQNQSFQTKTSNFVDENIKISDSKALPQDYLDNILKNQGKSKLIYQNT